MEDTLSQMREELVGEYGPGGKFHLSPGHPSSITSLVGSGARHVQVGATKRQLKKASALSATAFSWRRKAKIAKR